MPPDLVHTPPTRPHGRSGCALGVLTVLLVSCDAGSNARPVSPRDVTGLAAPDVARPASVHSGVRTRIDTVATGLEVPWGITELPDGRLLVTERPGRIRVVRDDVLLSEPWATLDVYAEDRGIGPETGLLGIAVAPDFTTSGHVYVVATTWRTDGDRSRSLPTRLWRRLAGRVNGTAALTLKNQLLRFTDRDGRGTAPEVIVDELPTAYYHAGGGLGFGPDGMLYVSMGDALLPQAARSGRSHLGRVLRFTPEGGVPPDNPQPDSPSWAMGLRNTQAFAWLADGTLVGVEHGPTGMRQEAQRGGHDELNVIVGGADYGWPDALGGESSRGSRPAVWTWEEAIAPAGLAVYHGPFAPWRGALLIAGLRGRLERVVLERAGPSWRVVEAETIIDGEFGRLRFAFATRGGDLYLSTSNRDARGAPRPGDDMLLRLTPELSIDETP